MKSGLMKCVVSGVLLASAFVAGPAYAEFLVSDLNGYHEVPSISTPGVGNFRAQINREGTEIRYELSYSGLATPVTQAHLHLGKRATNGGVMVFLCTGSGVPVGTPACPASPGVVTGVLTAANVVGPTGQGIAPGEFAEVIAAIRNGAAYANVHTETYPAGEIRGQVLDKRFHRLVHHFE